MDSIVGPAGWSVARSYRRMRVLDPVDTVASVGLLVAVEATLLWHLGPLAAQMSRVARWLAAAAGVPTQLGTDRFLGLDLLPLVFPVRLLGYPTVLLWIAGALAALAINAFLRRVPIPIRTLAAWNLAIVAVSAVYLLFAGHLGYEAEAFSRLYLRTVILVWVLMPLLVAALSFTLPLSPLARVALVALTIGYDVVLSTVRYATFAWLLARFGAVLMANLYLVLGPMLDAIHVVGVFSLVLVALARRLGPRDRIWAW